jgi:YgiT-type zinc finger domain-containing protein
MECSVEGCLGEYEKRKIIHTLRYRSEIIVIDNVPAEVCTVCGDVLLEPETVRRIEILLQGVNTPVQTAPVYEYMAVSF